MLDINLIVQINNMMILKVKKINQQYIKQYHKVIQIEIIISLSYIHLKNNSSKL